LFLLLRFLHGFSTGTTPTGITAYVADIIPQHKRGQAMGTLGIFSAVGMGTAPFIGSEMTRIYGINSLFMSSAFLSFLAIAILFKLPETLPIIERKKFSFSLLKLTRSEIWYSKATFPAVICFLLTFISGVVLTLVPLITTQLGFKNKGIFFALYTFIALLMRLAFAKVSDQKGRIPVLFVSTLFLVASLSVLTLLAFLIPNNIINISIIQSFTLSLNELLFFISSILFGMGWGLNSPTLQAWTVDVSEPQHRGKGIATMFIGFEAGIGCGAIIAGYLYSHYNHHEFTDQFHQLGFIIPFAIGILLALLACFLMFTSFSQKIYKNKI